MTEKFRSLMKNLNRKAKIVIFVGAFFVIAAIGLLIKYMQYEAKIKQNIIKLEDLTVQVTLDTESEAKPAAAAETEGATAIQPKPKHDFDALKQENGDVYAWISIPDTQVDYPVLQSTEDNKYLDTNIDGTSGYPGCIYSNVCNSREFDDYITVLYGHNMKSGEMFGSLHNFDEEDFFREFETYTVETEKAQFTYSVYAVVNYNDKLIPAYYDVKSASDRDAFLESLEECRENSITYFSDEIEIAGDDKVLVLSVCISGQENRRFLVVSKLEEELLY